jgi:hypothetical protein
MSAYRNKGMKQKSKDGRRVLWFDNQTPQNWFFETRLKIGRAEILWMTKQPIEQDRSNILGYRENLLL